MSYVDVNAPLVEHLEEYADVMNEDSTFVVFTFRGGKAVSNNIDASKLTSDVIPLEYLQEVSKALRDNCKFACDRTLGQWRRYYVYTPDSLFIMGWVAYGDYGLDTPTDDKFVVGSHRIINRKYSEDRDQHHMSFSTKMVTAVRSAKRYILPINHGEVARRTINDTKHTVNMFNSEVSSFAKVALSKIGLEGRLAEVSSSDVWAELCHKLDTNNPFLSAEFERYVGEAREKINVWKVHQSASTDMYCVRVYERLGKQVFDVNLISDVPNQYNWRARVHNTDFGNRRYNSMDELPEEIMNKISALSICEVGGFVEEVGHRSLSTLYYVYA